MATAIQQLEAETYLKGCRVTHVEIDGGLMYLHLEAPSANYEQAVVRACVDHIRWVDDLPERRSA